MDYRQTMRAALDAAVMSTDRIPAAVREVGATEQQADATRTAMALALLACVCKKHALKVLGESGFTPLDTERMYDSMLTQLNKPAV